MCLYVYFKMHMFMNNRWNDSAPCGNFIGNKIYKLSQVLF